MASLQTNAIPDSRNICSENVVNQAAQTSVGFDLTRALHEAASRQPILLATSSAIDVDVDALADAGVSELLRRPLVSTELAAALARCLRSRRVTDVT
jgi:CheY-like chemotaxis protein